MQSLPVISVNLWQIVAALLNLLLMFLIVKHFLYNRVRRVLDQRQETIEGSYRVAEEAKEKAFAAQAEYETKLADAETEAQNLIRDAVATANAREEELIADARKKADGILRQAETDAFLERRKAEETIKEEIVDVSAALAQKLLEREVKSEDHRDLIDRFLDDLDGADNGKS